MKKVVASFMALAAFALGTYAQSPCRGSLVVNEISNGANGSKEFVELLVISCSTCTESTVDISGWIIDDNNGIFTSDPAMSAPGLGISAGYLRLSNDSIWKNFEKGKLLVLFNQQNYDTTNTDFVNADGVDFYDAGTAIFVAVGYGSKLVERNNATPVATGSSRATYCGVGTYNDSIATAWDAITLNNDRNPGDGIQVRCPGCVGSLGEPSFFHGFSYGDTMNHVTNGISGFLDGAHYEFSAADTTNTGGLAGASGRAFQFFQNLNPGADANWRNVNQADASPGAPNSTDNSSFINKLIFDTITYTACDENTSGDPITNPGVLIVNEISNGPNGSKEFVELLTAGTGNADPTVDISGWIIDDNNGIFSSSPAIAATGLAISGGHLRLTNDPIWKNFPKGYIIVLFNKQDFDTTNANPGFVAADTLEYYDDGTAFWIAVGENCRFVEVNTSTPVVTGAVSKTGYCGAGSFAVRDTFAWNTISINNSRAGDGIQVRCEGCVGSLGEPAFYHGFSYGDTTLPVVNPVSGFIDGAHLDFLPLGQDTNAFGFEIGGTGRAFHFFQGSDPGNGANWEYIDAAAATPGQYNSLANELYRDSVFDGLISYACCEEDTTTEPPVNTGGTGGVLIMTEVSNGPSGSCEYVELLVAACGDNAATEVDIRGWILDDNSGNFSISGCGSGVGISSGHIRFDSVDTWSFVPVGSIIVLYNSADNCYNFPVDSTDANLDSVYYIAVGSNVSMLDRRTGGPSTSNCAYCDTFLYTPAISGSWANQVGLGNTVDAFQVRCPGCYEDNGSTVQPEFYHGLGYGTGNQSIAATAASLGGVYISGTGTGRKYEFYQGTAPGVDVNWRRVAADAAGTPPTTAGKVFAGFRDSVILKTLEFPCCGAEEGLSKAPAFNSIKEQPQLTNGVLVYPNPATDLLNVSVKSETSYEIRLVDLMGRVVFVQHYAAAPEATTVQINTAHLASGVYMYTVTTNGSAASGKVVIE